MSDHTLWRKLESTLNSKAESFKGVAGISLLDVFKGRRIEVNGDEQFPSASSIKVPLLAAFKQMCAHGEIDQLAYVDVDREIMVDGSGILRYLDDHVRLSWRDISNLMIILSDNTATNMVIDAVGFDRLARYVHTWGLKGTRMQRKMQDHLAYIEGRDNLMTPNDQVRMMELLADGSAFLPGVAAECMDVLKRPKRGYLSPGFPADVVSAGKPGGMEHVRCDMAMVFLKRRPFILSVMTKFGDMPPAAQECFVADVAREVYDVFAILDKTNEYGQGIPLQYR